MKSLIISMTILVGLMVTGNALAWQNQDDEALRKQHEEFVAAWNEHDAKAMAACFRADGDVINPFGRKAEGTAAIEKLFTEEHAGPMANSKYEGTIASIRYFGKDKDVAIIDVAGEITGIEVPDGAKVAPFVHHVTWIATKSDGKWAAVSARAFVTVPPLNDPTAPRKK